MKEIVIISGKGGTGKTSLTASFSVLAQNTVVADCDVDAADLHLILQPRTTQTNLFQSGYTAHIRYDECTRCGTCVEYCRFHAIVIRDGLLQVDPRRCEGCGVCAYVCPLNAIDMSERTCGQWFISETRVGPMVHARLYIGADNSGKLVNLIRNEARHVAEQRNLGCVLVDGPPGLGCPVIASITGATAVLVVTEPTLSGRHDLERTLALTDHFNIPTFICVNKWDINPQMTERIEREAKATNAASLGRIPYDIVFTRAHSNGKVVVDYTAGPLQRVIKHIWTQLIQAIDTRSDSS